LIALVGKVAAASRLRGRCFLFNSRYWTDAAVDRQRRKSTAREANVAAERPS